MPVAEYKSVDGGGEMEVDEERAGDTERVVCA